MLLGWRRERVKSVLSRMSVEGLLGKYELSGQLKVKDNEFFKLSKCFLKNYWNSPLYFQNQYKTVPHWTCCFLLVHFLKCFSFLFLLLPHTRWLVHIFQLQSSHFSKNTWNRLQKRVTVGWLPLLHLYIFSWSSEKRKSGELFSFSKNGGRSRKHKQVETQREKERRGKGNKYWNKTHEPKCKLKWCQTSKRKGSKENTCFLTLPLNLLLKYAVSLI